MGVCFFSSQNFLPPYSLRSQGIRKNSKYKANFKLNSVKKCIFDKKKVLNHLQQIQSVVKNVGALV
jgi:hypothetical protein